LKNALKNIDSKVFGVCQKCKGDINFKRIAFMPEILRCMKCAK
ncbi:MAG: RNA polymerase-binding transcription factor DksA, partial [Planctomycetota bacterium]